MILDNGAVSHARYCLLVRRRLLPMLSRDGRDRPIILLSTHVFLFLSHLLAQKLFSHVNPSIIRETLQRRVYKESDRGFG